MSEEQTGQIQETGVDHGIDPGEFMGDLTASIQGFFLSSQFSDLVIKTEEQEFKVHRLILCGQSKYFARLYKGDWAETTDNTVELNSDDPRAIEAMIHFMYGFDYDSSGNDRGRISPMLFNIRLYQVADKYFIPQLKKRAKDKFGQIARTCWQMDDFPIAITEVYRCTQKDDRDLRKLLVQISQDHNIELMKSENFRSVLEETVGFASDLAQSLSAARTSVENHCKYRCSSCSKDWNSCKPEAFYYCPFCSYSGVIQANSETE